MIFSDTAVVLNSRLLGRGQTHSNASYKLIAGLHLLEVPVNQPTNSNSALCFRGEVPYSFGGRME